MIEILDTLTCVMINICLATASAGIIALLFLAFTTRRITTFLLVTNWFRMYYKISQSALLSWEVTYKQRKQLKQKPVKAAIKAYGEMFAEDLKKLPGVLKADRHYRVTTHYTDLIDKFVESGEIELLCRPKIVNERRFLKELRPLLGCKDYRILKRCCKKNPAKDRCCEKCGAYEKCQCRRGDICPRTALKTFYQYDFKLTANRNHEKI